MDSPLADWAEKEKLLAHDGEAEDSFGFSVAINENYILVGAPGDDDLAHDSGAAYLFDAATGRQLFKLVAEDGAKYDQFGRAVGINGNDLLIGAPYKEVDGERYAGAAYLFDARTGEQRYRVTAKIASSREQYFGCSVAASQDHFVVGAFKEDANYQRNWTAYVFDAGSGKYGHNLTAEDSSAASKLCSAVAVSGNEVIVGAIADNDNGDRSGSAYIFDAETGKQIYKLTPEDGEAGGTFGYSVAISGFTAAVGALGVESVYIFDLAKGAQVHKLIADDQGLDYNSGFGASVAISGDRLLVGASLGDYRREDRRRIWDSGVAYLFDVFTGSQLQKLTPNGSVSGDFVGWAVDISGYQAVIGGPGCDGKGEESGASFVFDSEATPESYPRSDFAWRVAEIYIATLGYAPDNEGLQYWIDNLQTSGWTPTEVAQSFFDAPLVQEMYPTDQGYGPFIEALYEHLFGRAPDDAGYQYWLAELEAGRVQRNQMIIALIEGGWANAGATSDMARFGNRIQVGLAFAAEQAERGIIYSQLSENQQIMLREIGREVLTTVTDDSATREAAIGTISGLLDQL